MHTKRLIIISILVLLASTPIVVSAQTMEGDIYLLQNPIIVTSGGTSASDSYSIINTRVGAHISGKAESESYALDATNRDEPISVPSPPTVDDITTPTNVSEQILSGAKEANTAIYINGFIKVQLNNDTTWSYKVTLDQEGENDFFITAKNSSGLESEAVQVTITLDTVPPVIIITYPLNSTIVYENPLTVEYTVDGVESTQTEDLNFGVNTITIEETDEAGNTSQETINVWLIREPVALPPLP